TGGALARARGWPALLAAWAAYAVMLFPVSGLFQNGFQIAADRYTYLPCLPWALLAGAGITRLVAEGALAPSGRDAGGHSALPGGAATAPHLRGGVEQPGPGAGPAWRRHRRRPEPRRGRAAQAALLRGVEQSRHGARAPRPGRRGHRGL